MKNKISILASAILLVSVSFLSSCKDDEDTKITPEVSQSNVLVVHASPNAPGVDLLIDGGKVNLYGIWYAIWNAPDGLLEKLFGRCSI